MKSSKRKICQVLALVLSSVGATAAMAAGPIVQGGGSSLVAPTIGSISQPNTEIGLFGTSEATFTYFSVGSGAGQNAFLSNAPSFLGSTVSTVVDFANSDAALSTAQITSYKAALGTTNGPLIQIPYIVTPITIPLVNAPALTSTTTPVTTPNQASSIALNDDDLCGIFSGKMTNWNQVIDPTSTSKTTYSLNSPITVVYRADSSGTTELLTRHLAAVCTTTNTASGVTFKDSLTFTDSFPAGFPTGSSFVSASGSGGIRNTLVTLSAAGTAAVAYLSPDYTNTFLAPSSSSASSQLQLASLLNAKNNTYYAPTAANATTALGTIAPPSTKNLASNQANWVPNAGNPTAGYPVSGTSQIILSQCYAAPAVTTAVVDYLNNHFTNASYAAIVHGNGFDTVPSNYQTAISNDFLSNASGFNLNIGNTSVCTGSVTGR